MQTNLISRIAGAITGADLKRRIADLEAELKVRTDIMNITSIVSEADKKGDIVSINEKFIEVSKYSRSELIGQPHNTTRHPDMPKETLALISVFADAAAAYVPEKKEPAGMKKGGKACCK